VYSFGRAALLLLVEVSNHTVPVRERRRIRVNIIHVYKMIQSLYLLIVKVYTKTIVSSVK